MIKYRDPETGNFKEISVKASDTLPIGSIVDFDGENVPEGWEIIDDQNVYSASMRIKKVSQPISFIGKLLNERSEENTKDGYTCNYVNGIDNKFNYSQSEQLVGTWIDGKPLYRKVITYNNALPSNTSTFIGSLSTAIDNVVKIDYTHTNSSNVNAYALYSTSGSQFGYGSINVNKQNGDVYITMWNDSWSTPHLIVILEYTKTTD